MEDARRERQAHQTVGTAASSPRAIATKSEAPVEVVEILLLIPRKSRPNSGPRNDAQLNTRMKSIEDPGRLREPPLLGNVVAH